MTDDPVKQALAELQDVVRCRCHPAYTGRGLHDPDCECDSAEALKVVSDRIEELEAKLAGRSFYQEKDIDALQDRLAAQAAEIERLRGKLARAVEERDEAIRRRDAWKVKAEGYDAVRKALREKVGAPWPPNLSRALWAGLAADEKKRADDAEAKLAKAVAMLDKTRLVLAEWEPHPFPVLAQVRTTLAELTGAQKDGN